MLWALSLRWSSLFFKRFKMKDYLRKIEAAVEERLAKVNSENKELSTKYNESLGYSRLLIGELKWIAEKHGVVLNLNPTNHKSPKADKRELKKLRNKVRSSVEEGKPLKTRTLLFTSCGRPYLVKSKKKEYLEAALGSSNYDECASYDRMYEQLTDTSYGDVPIACEILDFYKLEYDIEKVGYSNNSPASVLCSKVSAEQIESYFVEKYLKTRMFL